MGSITLDEPVGKPDMLEVACHRCDRRGRLSLERVITGHGAERRQRHYQRPLRRPLPAAAGTVPGEPASMRFMADTIAAAVLALALVGMTISVIGLIGCGIAALLTRRAD
jgi:hypothetical protein